MELTDEMLGHTSSEITNQYNRRARREGEPRYRRDPGDLGSSGTVRGTLLSVVRATVPRRRWWEYRRLHGSSGRGCPLLAAGCQLCDLLVALLRLLPDADDC